MTSNPTITRTVYLSNHDYRVRDLIRTMDRMSDHYAANGYPDYRDDVWGAVLAMTARRIGGKTAGYLLREDCHYEDGSGRDYEMTVTTPTGDPNTVNVAGTIWCYWRRDEIEAAEQAIAAYRAATA